MEPPKVQGGSTRSSPSLVLSRLASTTSKKGFTGWIWIPRAEQSAPLTWIFCSTKLGWYLLRPKRFLLSKYNIDFRAVWESFIFSAMNLICTYLLLRNKSQTYNIVDYLVNAFWYCIDIGQILAICITYIYIFLFTWYLGIYIFVLGKNNLEKS